MNKKARIELKKIKMEYGRKQFAWIAYLFILFIILLDERLNLDRRKKVLFFSREGEFYKKIYDWYRDNISKREVQTEYFYVSRKATMLPSIFKITKDSFQEIYKNYSTISMIDFLNNLNILDECMGEANLQSILNDEKIKNFEESEQYRFLLNSKFFKEICIQKAEDQRKLFLDYLNKVNGGEKELCFVDIGFDGTMQNNIAKIFEGEIFGYYMILNQKAPETLRSHKYGVLFDHKRSKNTNVLEFNRSVVEIILMASHNSVKMYQKQLKGVEPVFDYNQQELDAFQNTISEIQENIFHMFKRLAMVIKKYDLKLNDYQDYFVKEYGRNIINPKKDEITTYISIPVFDNFASFKSYKSGMDSGWGGWRIL